MRDVESRNVVKVVPPNQRPFACIGDCESPDSWIQIRYAYSSHAVLSVAVGERVAEDGIKKRDVAFPDRVGSIRRWLLAPGSGNCHQPTPAGSSSSVSSATGSPNDDSTMEAADAGS